MMDLDHTEQLLSLIQTYWPNSTYVQGMNVSWTEALREYHRAEVWEALRKFRSEEERKFAPTISELIGRMDYYRERRAAEKAAETLLLEAPTRSFVSDPIETYSYKTSRTTPKKKKDDSDHEVRKAVRCTRERRREIHESMMRQGFVKEVFDLGNGRKGSRYVRA